MRRLALGDLVEIKGGGTPIRKESSYWNGDLPWATVKDFNSTELSETQETITRLGVANSATNIIPAGTIVVPTRMAVGKAAVTSVEMAINQDLKALIIRDNSQVDQRYLLRFLLHKARELVSMAKGATVKGITLDVLQELKILLPPLPEQKRIAAILDKADAIRRKRQKAIALADQFLRSVFLDLFGDPVTNPKGWPPYSIGDLCTIVRGSSPRPKGDSRYYGGPIPRLMVQDLTRDGKHVTPRIDSLTVEGAKLSRPIDAGTVVMAVSGNVGLTAILEIDACIHDGFIAMNGMNDTVVEPSFMVDLLMFLKSTHSAREAGAIFKNLTTSQIKEMEVPIPPIVRQEEYLRVVNQLSRVTQSEESVGAESEKLFQSLSKRAFAGQL